MTATCSIVWRSQSGVGGRRDNVFGSREPKEGKRKSRGRQVFGTGYVQNVAAGYEARICR